MGFSVPPWEVRAQSCKHPKSVHPDRGKLVTGHSCETVSHLSLSRGLLLCRALSSCPSFTPTVGGGDTPSATHPSLPILDPNTHGLFMDPRQPPSAGLRLLFRGAGVAPHGALLAPMHALSALSAPSVGSQGSPSPQSPLLLWDVQTSLQS